MSDDSDPLRIYLRACLEERDARDQVTSQLLHRGQLLLARRTLQHLVTGYRIPAIEVDGEMGDIIDVFVRINSTGKALTPQEKRRAKYYNSSFLKDADKLARRYEGYFLDNDILSGGQISRMKHVELVCELMLSVHQGDVINKKAALDRVMKTDGFNARDTAKAVRRTTAALNRVRRMFPKLHQSRHASLGASGLESRRARTSSIHGRAAAAATTISLSYRAGSKAS